MALAAQRHVHVFSSNHRLAVLAGSAEREACVLLAELADGRQFLYLLALGDEAEDCGEGATQESALQRRDDDDFT